MRTPQFDADAKSRDGEGGGIVGGTNEDLPAIGLSVVTASTVPAPPDCDHGGDEGRVGHGSLVCA